MTVQENEYCCEPEDGLLKQPCMTSRLTRSSVLQEKIPQSKHSKARRNMGGEDWPDVLRTYRWYRDFRKRKRLLGMCLSIEALIETTMSRIQETVRNTLLCREKWKRTADKAIQRKPRNREQPLLKHGARICGCPWDQLGGLRGQIHFHCNDMKTWICGFHCTDILMTEGEWTGKISQEHRSDQDARTASLVVTDVSHTHQASAGNKHRTQSFQEDPR